MTAQHLDESGAAYESILDATKNLVEESGHLTAEQQEEYKLGLKQLQSRAEAVEQYERIAKAAKETLLAKEKEEKLANKNLINERTNKQKILSSSDLQTDEIKTAIADYEKISTSLIKAGGKARETTKEFKALSDAIGETKANEVANAIDNYSMALDKEKNATKEVEIAEESLIDANINLKGSTDDLYSATEKYNQSLEKTRKPLPELGNTIVGIAQGLMSVSMAISTIKGLGEIWSNEDTNYWEKLLSTITAVGMALPMIIIGFKSLKASLLDMPMAIVAFVAGLNGIKKAELELAIETFGLRVVLKAAMKDLLIMASSALASIAPLVIIIGALTLAGWGLYEVYNADANAAKKAAEAAENLAKEYDRVKQSYDELKKSLEDYNSAKKALDELTEGTQEWKDAVIELNNQVLELLDKYPQLIDYIESSNGILSISDQGQNALLESQSQEIKNAYQVKLIGQIQKDTTQNKSDFTDLGRRNLYEQAIPASDLTVYAGVDSKSVEKAINAIIKHGDIILQNSVC